MISGTPVCFLFMLSRIFARQLFTYVFDRVLYVKPHFDIPKWMIWTLKYFVT